MSAEEQAMEYFNELKTKGADTLRNICLRWRNSSRGFLAAPKKRLKVRQKIHLLRKVSNQLFNHKNKHHGKKTRFTRIIISRRRRLRVVQTF
jgi:hypothetical protein